MSISGCCNLVNHRIVISPHLVARINLIGAKEEARGTREICSSLYVCHTCIRGRVNDVITLIRIGVLGPGVQGEFVTSAENRTWRRYATHCPFERSTRGTIINL